MCTTTLFPSSRNMYSSGLTPSMLRSTHALISSERKTEIIIWNITQIIQVFIIKVIIDFPKQKNPTHFTTFTTFFPSRLIIRNSKQRNNMGALILHMSDWKVKVKETFFNKRISRIGALFPYRFLSMLIPCDFVFNDNNISSRIASAKYFLCLLKFYIFSVLSPFCVNLNFRSREKKSSIPINLLLHDPVFNQFKAITLLKNTSNLLRTTPDGAFSSFKYSNISRHTSVLALMSCSDFGTAILFAFEASQ